MTDDHAYHSAVEVETRRPSSRVIVASFLRAQAPRSHRYFASLRRAGGQELHARWCRRRDGPKSRRIRTAERRLGKQSGADYPPEGDDVAERRRVRKERDTVYAVAIRHPLLCVICCGRPPNQLRRSPLHRVSPSAAY